MCRAYTGTGFRYPSATTPIFELLHVVEFEGNRNNTTYLDLFGPDRMKQYNKRWYRTDLGNVYVIQPNDISRQLVNSHVPIHRRIWKNSKMMIVMNISSHYVNEFSGIKARPFRLRGDDDVLCGSCGRLTILQLRNNNFICDSCLLVYDRDYFFSCMEGPIPENVQKCCLEYCRNCVSFERSELYDKLVAFTRPILFAWISVPPLIQIIFSYLEPRPSWYRQI